MFSLVFATGVEILISVIILHLWTRYKFHQMNRPGWGPSGPALIFPYMEHTNLGSTSFDPTNSGSHRYLTVIATLTMSVR